MSKSPLSTESVARYLRIDCPEDIEGIIQSGKSRAKQLTGFDYDEGKRVEYFEYCKQLPLPSDDVRWQLEIHKGGSWVNYPAQQVGDEICLTQGKVSCCCDCSSCDGNVKLRLTTTAQDCSSIYSDVELYVKEYTAYFWQNRGAIEAQKLNQLSSILRPYMKVAFA